MLNVKPKLRPPKKRKTRSDKKRDIRVPISFEEYNFVLYCSRSKKQSITQFCTELVREYIEKNTNFEEMPYDSSSEYMVHVKPNQLLYESMVNLSVSLNCRSMREATHRILANAIFYMQGGTHVESVQRKEFDEPGTELEITTWQDI
ncbi:DNA gyrase/topoisomerase IV subunit B [Evansella vedderi]|uniref:DNA gyrase/topoisomerase IV subunit B n=1 Tax=Evansella vedderi TaxID=38282 RepID=A0ABT9ZVG8_9BACI|nr:hypothetical protein [Evansella vedderi]MDQ0254945.1 DNA gyrase/topoisomerase IV subunit B [Evansella vedderi]